MKISLLYNQKKSCREIAKIIGRSPSTISKEIKRNSILLQNYQYKFITTYVPETADQHSKKRRKKKDILSKYDASFFEALHFEITKKYRSHSVESLVYEWKKLYSEKRIPSFKTVYRFIHLNLLKLKLFKLPRMSKLRPRTKKNSKPKNNKKILGTSNRA